MKRKEVEDVMGGKDAWANVDKTDGMFCPWACVDVVGVCFGGLLADLIWWDLVAQCPREGCDGSQAFFYQVQIRSADEPMTTFLKVGVSCCRDVSGANMELVYDLWSAMERKLSDILSGTEQLQRSFSRLGLGFV